MALGVIVVVIGIAYVVLGTWLIVLRGSAYYAFAGVGWIVAGILLGRGKRKGHFLYLAVFIASVLWTLCDVGWDGWQWMPRLFVFAVIGLLGSLLLWWDAPRARTAEGTVALIYAVAIAIIFVAGTSISHSRFRHYGNVAAASPPGQVASGNDNDWRHYGHTMAGQRFSPSTQLTAANVGRLAKAWEFHTGDLPRKGEQSNGREFNFEVTPTKVGNTLYICTPHRSVIALDATTGRQRWRFDPKNDTTANEYLACRGVAYYEDAKDSTCPRRVITTTADARMVALDADRGIPCEDFGNHGYVSLTDHMGPVPPGFHFITSQPLVINDRVVLGGWIYDNQSVGEPSGVVRAYDPATGRLAWAWDLGRSNPTAPLAPGETYTRGTPNAWGSYTADPKLGMIYLPLGNATPDYYGARRRPTDEAYSSSVVALDAETGRERWHFQTVHHDVWDFDVPIGPSLIDLPAADGSTTPALIQTTKMGQLFLLDRRNGKPLTPIVERKVPTEPHLPGERPSSTQPYVEGFPSLAPADLKESDAWGATPIDHLICRVQFKRYRYQQQYTLPALGTSIAYPAFDGIVDWYGATVDPTRHLLIANTSYIPFTMEVMPAQDAIKKGLMSHWPGWRSGQPYPKPKEFAVGPQYGTPYAAIVKPWLSVLDAPCNAPPWGTLVAIDYVTRKIVWERPVGTTRDMNLFHTHINAPLPTGIFSMGGNIATATGLIFMGATADDYLRAYDERTGSELWKARLPAGGQATPITYIGDDGRQYVVIAAGGHGGLQTNPGDAIVAYADSGLLTAASTAGEFQPLTPSERPALHHLIVTLRCIQYEQQPRHLIKPADHTCPIDRRTGP